MQSKKLVASLVAGAFVVSSCATASRDISAAYVSPMQYNGFDCEQIQEEVQRLQSRLTQLGGRLDQAASNDKAIMGVGLVLLWPTLFALGGTKQQEAEYARLKGEFDALEQARIAKKCSIKTNTQTVAPGAAPTASTEAGPGEQLADPSAGQQSTSSPATAR
jgi:hypothetical protein